MKTKNFHWHMSGSHFRDYHLLLDEHANDLFAMTDLIAERIRKTGGTTLRSIGRIARDQRISDNDAEYVEPMDVLAELRDDNMMLVSNLREVHETIDELGDIATASLIETWIDEGEKRTWFLFEATRHSSGAAQEVDVSDDHTSASIDAAKATEGVGSQGHFWATRYPAVLKLAAASEARS
jgi:starvation-inducible DNA-binding protein